MPLVDLNHQSGWDRLYEAQVGDTVYHFERPAKDIILGRDHFSLRDALGLRPHHRIALIGAGFGWVAEDWINDGFPHVVAVDISEWVHANKDKHAAVPILDADCRTQKGRDVITAALGGSVDWAISEDVLPILTNTECRDLIQGMRILAPEVAHWITPCRPESGLNSHTLKGWKHMVKPDLVVQRGRGEAL